jgi:hypothetical protein
MYETKILQLAIEALEYRKAEVELEIEAIQIMLRAAIPGPKPPVRDHPGRRRRSKRTKSGIDGMKR